MTRANRSIVYVSCSKGDCIEVLALDRANGTLARVDTVALPGNGMPLTIAPDRRHLYAAVSATVDGAAEPQYATYRIDPSSGTLTHVSTIKAPGRMSHITVDRSGSHLLGASVSNDLIASHKIEPDGRLRPEATQILTVPSKAHQITTNLTNQFAFVPNLGADLVMQLTFDADTGRLTDSTPARNRPARRRRPTPHRAPPERSPHLSPQRRRRHDRCLHARHGDRHARTIPDIRLSARHF